MILQYFKKKENEYKIKSDKIYLIILNKSKSLLNKKYFNEIDFLKINIMYKMQLKLLFFLCKLKIGWKKLKIVCK